MKKLNVKELCLLLLPVAALGLVGFCLHGRIYEPAERITRVYNDGQQIVVEGQLNTPHDLLLTTNQGQPCWTSSVDPKTGTFKAFIKPSQQIPFGNGSFGRGFIFKGSGGQANIAITKGGPMPYGAFILRDNNKLTQQEGIFTVADIKQGNGTLLPVCIQLKAKL